MATTFSANRSALFFLFSSFFFRPTIDPEEIETDSFYFSFPFFFLFLLILLLLLVFLFSFFLFSTFVANIFLCKPFRLLQTPFRSFWGGGASLRGADWPISFLFFFGISFFLFGPNIHCRLLRDLFSLSVRGFRFFFGAFLAFFGGPPPHQVPPPPPLSFSFSFVCFIFYFLFFGRNLKNPTPARPYLPDVSGKKIKK